MGVLQSPIQPPYSGKPIIFRAKAKYFEQKPTAKMEKYFFVLPVINQKTEFILSQIFAAEDLIIYMGNLKP